MPRRPRAVFPGVAHHLTQRGNDRQAVFHSPEDRRLYLDLLSHHAARSGARVLGYCLMTNHIHLVAVPEFEHSLARALGRAHSEYALAVNRAAGRSGHLWQNRFFSCPMEEAHLANALRYIDLNPVRAGLAAIPWDWPWSSARAHTVEHARDAVLDCDWTGYCGHWDYLGWRDLLASGMANEESIAVREATRTGEPLGSREFVMRLEREAGRRLRVFPRGRPKAAPKTARDEGVQECLLVGGDP
jgi:putative transposase